MSQSIPAKWLEYKPYGSVIPGTKILPFKVPLKQGISINLEPDQRFTPPALLEAFPRLKYIIDLTNTDRYYDVKEFTKAGVKYEKIMVRGQEIPSMDLVLRFFKVMDEFTSACGEDEIVGVHCTHGVNRTGYLICRYLIQQLGWEVADCLKAFEKARGYPIERYSYLNELKRTPREKIDTSKIKLSHKVNRTVGSATVEASDWRKMRSFAHARARQPPYAMCLPHFGPPRRGFSIDGPFSPPHFNFTGPPPMPFRPMLPPPGLPPPIPPPLPGRLPAFGPKPFRYGPPPRPAMPPPPPRLGFVVPGVRPPVPLRTPVRAELAPPVRLPPTAMPPPKPPQSAPGRPVELKGVLESQNRKLRVTNGMANPARCRSDLIRRNKQMNRVLPKLFGEQQDFTIDTFEENLLAVSGHPNRRLPKGRYNQSK